MEVHLEKPLKVNAVKSVDKLIILTYNLVLVTGASYLVVVHDVTAWIYLIALCFAASWKENRND